MEKLQLVGGFFPMIAIITTMGVAGWDVTTWMRIKHCYPLDGAWGQAIYPKTDAGSVVRMKLLTSENARLQAEIGSVKDRLETIERIVTDRGFDTAAQIEALRAPRLTAQDELN